MSPDSARNYNVYVGPSPSFSISLVTKPSQSTTMRYDPYTQRVWVHGLGVNGRCLAGGGQRPPRWDGGLRRQFGGPALDHHGRPPDAQRFTGMCLSAGPATTW